VLLLRPLHNLIGDRRIVCGLGLLLLEKALIRRPLRRCLVRL
jgi:hypothetical protein